MLAFIAFSVAIVSGLAVLYLNKNPPKPQYDYQNGLPMYLSPSAEYRSARDRHERRVKASLIICLVSAFLGVCSMVPDSYTWGVCPPGYVRAPIFVAGHPGYQCLPQRGGQ